MIILGLFPKILKT